MGARDGISLSREASGSLGIVDVMRLLQIAVLIVDFGRTLFSQNLKMHDL
jgi:hypothetical protein